MFGKPAPALHPSLDWLNADPQTIANQRGRVLALLFWNASSVYSQNLIGELTRLRARHPLALSVIGIHLPKFDAEIDPRTVSRAVNQLDIDFPVANDRGWAVWQQYGITGWPSVALIDPLGRLREIYTGDDQADAIDGAISTLVEESGGSTTFPEPGARSTIGRDRATLAFPSGLAVSDSHLYIADTGHHRILECAHEGRVLRAFGTGHPDLVDGPPGEAAFRSPRGLCIVRGSLYVADTGNHALRRIELSDGQVETLLGSARPGQPIEGSFSVPADCPLNLPWAVAGAFDRLFIAVTGCNQIWEYELGYSRLRFVAGTGELGIADGPGRNALFAQPSGLALVQQTLYVADAAGSAIRVIQLQQDNVQTLVGQGLYEFGDHDGGRREARLQYPQAIALDANAPVLWIADTYNGSLRKLRLGGGDVTTQDLPQPLYQPAALASSADALWIADGVNHEILRYDLESGLLARVQIAE